MPDRILLVDDEIEIADLIEIYLKNENYPRPYGRGRDFQHRGLCTKNGLKRLYPSCRPCPGKRAGFLTAALLQQSQPGSRTRPHLRRVPGRNRRTAKRL